MLLTQSTCRNRSRINPSKVPWHKSNSYNITNIIKMPVVLYGFERSPMCRAVMLTIRAIGLETEFKNVDLVAHEQKTEAFKKINPAGLVPVLDDNGLHIWESRAINSYLVNQYGKDDTLYPKSHKKRAIVDTMLHFDTGSLNPKVSDYMKPQLFLCQPADPDLEAVLKNNLAIFEVVMGQRNYAAGDHITIADFSIISTLETLVVSKFNLDEYPNTVKWMNRLKANVPFYNEVTKKGVDALRRLIRERLGIE